MKQTLLPIVFVLLFIGCNHVPNKSITEPLSVKELSKAKIGNSIIAKELFAIHYYKIREYVDGLSEYEKVKCYELTYRGFVKLLEYMDNEKKENEKEWHSKYYQTYYYYCEKIDSLLNYWENAESKSGMINMVLFCLDEREKLHGEKWHSNQKYIEYRDNIVTHFFDETYIGRDQYWNDVKYDILTKYKNKPYVDFFGAYLLSGK